MNYTPMKGQTLKVDSKLPEGNYYVSVKLDGVRATWSYRDQKLYSYNWKEITSCPHLVQQLTDLDSKLYLDMELYSHKLTHEDINGAVRSKCPTDNSMKLEAYIFDMSMATGTFNARNLAIPDLIETTELHRIEQFLIHSSDMDFEQMIAEAKLFGHEGYVLISVDNIYTPGRAKDLFKLKPRFDAEFKLIGFNPAKSGRNVETFASLVLESPNGETFNCSGINDIQRKFLFETEPFGQMVKVEYDKLSTNGIPVMPRYICIRGDL